MAERLQRAEARAERRRRQRVLGPLPIASIIAAALAGFWLLRQDAGAAGQASELDPLAIAYLQAALAKNPADTELRLRLARAQFANGLLDEADRTLAPLADKPAAPAEHEDAGAPAPSRLQPRSPLPRPRSARPRRRVQGRIPAVALHGRALAAAPHRARAEETSTQAEEVRILAFDVAHAQWRAATPGTPARAAAEKKVLERLRTALAGDLGSTALVHLAQAAHELGHTDFAVRAHERLASVDPGRCAEWLAEAARELLALGAPARAGESFAQAYACERDDRKAMALGRQALSAYLAADKGLTALKLVQALVDRRPSDEALLREAERIALSQSDSESARRFGARLISLGVNDPAVLGRQIDLALAAGNPAGALAMAQQLAKVKGDDVASRLRVAQLASWAGQPGVALQQWMWLAQRGEPTDAAEKALQLARALGDEHAIVELLERQSEKGPLTASALQELLRVLESAEGPRRALEALRAEVKRHPESPLAWEQLAQAQERRRDLAGALATRSKRARQLGASQAESMRIAKLQWALGRSADALRELERWSAPANDDAAYWSLVGELAWDREADDVALRAYLKLWELDRVDALGVERLVILTRTTGRSDEVIRLGSQGFARTHQPRLLLIAMDEAASAGKWGELRRLADLSSASEAAFATQPAYWLLRARLEEHEQHIRDATASYRRALELDPKSTPARAGLLWLYVGAHDRRHLAEGLQAWSGDAWSDPALGRACAAGLALLGRDREALAFYEHDARSDPSDEGAMERYALALERSGDKPAADGVRRHIERRDAGSSGSSGPGFALAGRQEIGPPDLTGLVRAEQRRGAPRVASVRGEVGADGTGPISTQRAYVVLDSEAFAARFQIKAGGTLLSWSDSARQVDSKQEGELLLRALFAALGGQNELVGGASLRSDATLPVCGLSHSRQLARFAQGGLDAFLNEPADESAAMRMQAARTRAGGALAVGGQALHGRTTATWKRWSDRSGGLIGNGALLTAEIGYGLLAVHPEISARLQGSYQRNALAAGAESLPVFALTSNRNDVLPPQFTMIGLGVNAARFDLGPIRLSGDVWVGGMGPPIRPSYRVQLGVAASPFRGSEISLTGFTGNDSWMVGGTYGVGVSVTHRFPR